MPDAIITSTESTFGTISGTFAADQSTITGTIYGGVTGTIDGSVGVPGPQGPAGSDGVGVPIGGTTGQALVKTSDADYATGWTTLSNGATESWVTANFYPLSGNPSGFLTSTALTPYLLSSTAASTYAPLSSPSLSGVPTAPTATLGDDSTQIATTAFVQDAIIAGSAHAETLVATVRNATGATLPAGTVVYINGAAGNRATVAKAQANAEATSAGTFAVVETAIANNADGVVVITGVLSNQDTSAYADGDKLYLSPTVAGGVTTTKPSAPNHLVYVATVTRAHPTLGTLEVRIQNGYELGEIHDVALSSVTDNDLLAYNASTGLWNNESFSTLGLLTSANAASTYLTQANAASTYLTQANAASTYQTISGMSSYLTTSAASTTYAALAGATFTGLVSTPAATTASAFLRIPHGTAPTTPTNGDVWSTTSGLFARINGGTQQYAPLGSTNTFTGTNTFSGATLSFGTSTAASTINIGTGATLTATTKAVNIGTNGVAGSTTNIAIGSTTGTSTTTLNGTTNGVTAAADTNSVALATTAFVVGQAGSATPLVNGTAAVGTSLRYARQDHVHPTDTTRAALASPTFTGTPAAPTAAVDTNTTQIATTAYVVGQGYLKSATASSTYAPLASPTFTGVPTAPTATAGTNTTQIATTAFVAAAVSAGSGAVWGSITGTLSSQTDLNTALGLKAPLASPTFTGTVTIPAGASISGYATTSSLSSYAPLASPALTGTPTAPTALTADNSTTIATTAFVKAQGYLTSAPVTSVAGRTGDVTLSTTDISGISSYAPLASPTFTGTVTIPAGASISGYATTASLSSYAPLASPALTGTPTAPTALTADNSTTIATTAFVKAQGYLTIAPVTSVAGRTGAVTLSNTDISGLGTMATANAADYSTTTVANGLYYPLSTNPAGYLTSAPVTSVAGRTGAVTLAVADVSGAAPLASPTFTGTPAAPTAAANTNTTQIATTAFVRTDNKVKAWVQFNGTGTVAIRGSFNVTSITDGGVGTYTVNFTTAMSDVNFATVGSVSNDASSAMGFQPTARATGSVGILTRDTSAGTLVDLSSVSVAVFR